jgi:hypothetical protein
MNVEFDRQGAGTGINRPCAIYWRERNPAKPDRFIEGNFDGLFRVNKDIRELKCLDGPYRRPAWGVARICSIYCRETTLLIVALDGFVALARALLEALRGSLKPAILVMSGGSNVIAAYVGSSMGQRETGFHCGR